MSYNAKSVVLVCVFIIMVSIAFLGNIPPYIVGAVGFSIFFPLILIFLYKYMSKTGIVFMLIYTIASIILALLFIMEYYVIDFSVSIWFIVILYGIPTVLYIFIKTLRSNRERDQGINRGRP